MAFRRIVLATAFAAALAGGASPVAAAETAACPTSPTYLPTVPTPQSVIGFPLGLGQPLTVSTAQSNQYVEAVDAASNRVVSFDWGRAVSGQPIKYALVSTAANVRPAALKRIAANIRALRFGTPPPAKARKRRPGGAAASGASGAGGLAGRAAWQARLARTTPAIIWIASNVHGGERSGTDASLRVLYELAARTDCDVQNRLKKTLVVINPTQNPDGRDDQRRQNRYGFDMNRDWFARTQPETDSKIELLRIYEPQVLIDDHEMGGRRYFFPPNADPIHHDIADEVVRWINEIGEANKQAFGYNGACDTPTETECYFNYDIYDLFFMGYGDTGGSAGFGAAGMTYEKGSASAVPDRVEQQFRTQWATVGWLAANKVRVLREYAKHFADARAQGRAGLLEPNIVVEPRNTVQFPVPDIRIRHYFFLPNRQLADVRKLVERLRGMDVQVYRLTRSLTVPNARIFGGRSASGFVVPKGSYWVPMSQTQKRWIQATLGEDPYAPFPYFYDVSSWSNPLLMGVPTVYTGDALRPRAARVTGDEGGFRRPARRGQAYSYKLDSARAADFTFRLLELGVPLYRDLATTRIAFGRSWGARVNSLARSHGVTLAASSGPLSGERLKLPSIGVFSGTGVSTTAGSHGEIRYVAEQNWGVGVTQITEADINAAGGGSNAFRELKVLIWPDSTSSTAGLTAAGQANLRAWVSQGRIAIFLRRATRVARTALLTSTTERARPSGYQVLGSHFRVDVNHASPVGSGRPQEDFQFNNDDPILNPSTTGVNVLTYPTDNRFWYNGYAVNAEALKGSVSLVDEPVGSGRAILFAYNPLFRAYEESGEHLVANAVLYPIAPGLMARAQAGRQIDLTSAAGKAEALEAQSESVEDPFLSGWRPITIRVAAADLEATREIVGRYTDEARFDVVGDSAFVTIANPEDLYKDDHPFSRALVRTLRREGVDVRSVGL